MDRKRILVVDDEPFMRSLLIDLVSELEVDIDQAADGLEALEKLKVQTYWVVLSDIRMPRMGGLELFESALDSGILAPFIFLTGYSDDEMVLRALKLGAVDFLGKPFLPLELTTVVARTLELGQRRIELTSEIIKSSPELIKKLKA